MSRTLKALMLTTDILFLVYWTVSLLALVKIVQIPPSLMYAGYQEPRVVAWNWSFLPVDLLFSLSGLTAVWLERRGDPRWRPIALVSLCFTFTAGLMAVSYWALLGEFDPSWFLPNLALVIWPLAFVRGLIGQGRPRR